MQQATVSTDIEKAHEVLRVARDVRNAQETVTGEHAVMVDGPGGVWKVKMYKNGRGYLHLNVTPPGIQSLLYSIDSIERTLVEHFGIPGSQFGIELGPNPMEVDNVPGVVEGAEDHIHEDNVRRILENRCARRIQSVIRARYIHVIQTLERDIRFNLFRLQDDLNRVVSVRQVQITAFAKASHAETLYAEQNPKINIITRMPLYINNIPSSGTPVNNLLGLMCSPTGLERDAVIAYADTLMAHNGKNTNPYKCAKAIKYETHYPLIIGALPLPPIGVFSWKMYITDNKTYVRCSNTLHDNHAGLLIATFGPKWVDHVREVVNLPRIRVFDYYKDSNMTDYIGSIILSKQLLRSRGNVFPALHIESFNTVNKGIGSGTLIMNFCKSLLLSDCTSITRGIIFAQCLKIDFWDYRMNETNYAKALVIQMEMLFNEYSFEKLCTMRMCFVENDDDTLPSPAKKQILSPM